MKNLVMIILIPFLMGASCKPLDGPEYSVNQSFSAKVNGKIWRPFVDDFKLQETSCQIKVSFDAMSIRARNTRSSETIFIILSTPGSKLVVGKYPLNSTQYKVGTFSSGQNEYSTGSGYSGEIEISSIDTSKKKISGNFHYRCFNSVLNEVVEVSNGQFDLFYTEYGN